MWQALYAHIQGRNAVNFERERRTTLLIVPLALPPGTQIYDQRADGSVLQIRIPPTTRINVILGRSTDQGIHRSPSLQSARQAQGPH
jgi:hypothetical protein